MQNIKDQEVRRAVSQHYAKIAEQGGKCCAPGHGGTCCGPTVRADEANCLSSPFAYSELDINLLPQGANLGLGCGNPTGLAAVQPGEALLDLGCGGGIDCFIAAKQVGAAGLVIGVDMTPEMLAKARRIADQNHFDNVEFRLGEMENLPVADGLVDVIISNCVINLSWDKPRVFAEAMRVLKPGGRLAISDMIALVPLPPEIENDPTLYCGCIGGALFVNHLEGMLNEAGFEEVRIQTKGPSLQPAHEPVTRTNIRDFVVPASIEAHKPR